MVTPTPPPRVACPQCGGAVTLGPADPFVTCPSCRGSLYVDLARVVRHVVLRGRLGVAEAQGALARWLRAAEADVPRLSVRSRLELHPWWEVGAGRDALLRPAASKTAFLPPPRRAHDGGVADAVDPGAGLPEGALAPTVALEATESGAAPPARLVHVPYWRFEFDVAGKVYVAHVDAVEGQVAALVLPPSATRRLDRSAVAQLAVATAVFGAIAALVPGFFATVLVSAVVGALLYLAVRRTERRA